MSLKLILTLCMIFALWTSTVTGTNIIVHGKHWHNEITGWRWGQDSRSNQYKIDSNALGNAAYDDFTKDTVVVAEGSFHIYLRRWDEPRKRIVLLPHPTRADGTKVYRGGWSGEFNMAFKSHKGTITINLLIKPNGDAILDIYIYAGAWASGTNSDVKSHIDRLMISISPRMSAWEPDLMYY